MLVTERPGRLRIVAKDGTLSEPIKGVPEVFGQGQGGLLGITLDPKFSSNKLIYFAYAEPGEGGPGTAVARAKLGEDSLDDVEVIFRQKPKVDGGNHFGGRVVFAPDGKLFVTLGERFKFDPAQDLSSHLGKIVRINPDGSVPDDNPFVGQDGKLPEIWSYGHRNVQGAAIHPDTGKLWENEFGPKGGDELNIPEAGKNYGWPVVSWGKHYDGKEIPNPPTHPEFADAIASLDPGDLAVRHDLLHRRRLSRVERQFADRGPVLGGDRQADARRRKGHRRRADTHGDPHPRRGARARRRGLRAG